MGGGGGQKVGLKLIDKGLRGGQTFFDSTRPGKKS